MFEMKKDKMIGDLLQKIETELDVLNELDFNFFDNNNEFDTNKVLSFFDSKYKVHGLNPLITVYFLTYIQFIKEPEYFNEYKLEDLKRVFIKLNDYLIRLAGNLEDCLYFLDVVTNDQLEANVQKEKLLLFVEELKSKISEFEKNQ